jgi:hypothetical protein
MPRLSHLVLPRTPPQVAELEAKRAALEAERQVGGGQAVWEICGGVLCAAAPGTLHVEPAGTQRATPPRRPPARRPPLPQPLPPRPRSRRRPRARRPPRAAAARSRAWSPPPPARGAPRPCCAAPPPQSPRPPRARRRPSPAPAPPAPPAPPACARPPTRPRPRAVRRQCPASTPPRRPRGAPCPTAAQRARPRARRRRAAARGRRRRAAGASRPPGSGAGDSVACLFCCHLPRAFSRPTRPHPPLTSLHLPLRPTLPIPPPPSAQPRADAAAQHVAVAARRPRAHPLPVRPRGGRPGGASRQSAAGCRLATASVASGPSRLPASARPFPKPSHTSSPKPPGARCASRRRASAACSTPTARWASPSGLRPRRRRRPPTTATRPRARWVADPGGVPRRPAPRPGGFALVSGASGHLRGPPLTAAPSKWSRFETTQNAFNFRTPDRRGRGGGRGGGAV